MITNNEITNYLKSNGIKPSVQRIMVYEIIRNSESHPTVDQIYSELSPKIPTLSKATVYNTVHLFLNQKIIRSINIDENQVRYDWNTDFHGHFKCNNCEKVIDFHVQKAEIEFNELKDFTIMESHFYIKGICKTCNNILNN